MAASWDFLIDKHKDTIAEIVQDTYRGTKTVHPAEANLLRALDLTSPSSVKVVIIGQDPYPNANADGLAFSCAEKVSPSLRAIFRELEDTTGIKNTNGDLTAWARQGVLLLNTILTVEKGRPLSHQSIGWEVITSDVLLALAGLKLPPIFVAWGKHAQKLLEHLEIQPKYGYKVIKGAHPSPLARGKFFGGDYFRKINRELVKRNQEPIDWRT